MTPPRIETKDKPSSVSRVAMVTGVGGAMGAAIARALLAEGHRVVLADPTSPWRRGAALGEGRYRSVRLSDPQKSMPL